MNAESLVTALEKLPAGEPWAEPAAAAEAAIAAEHARAVAKLFPAELAPTTADAVAEYGWRIGRLGPAGYDAALAVLHQRALVGHPELARLLRSTDALADCEAAAAQVATPANHLEAHATAGARAAAEARARYQRAIAAQLADSKHELAPAARALLAAENLSARLAAARGRHEEHAVAELERAEAERKAAARAVRDKTAERVREAERKAADAAEIAGVTAAEYRRLRADWFVERLRATGLRQLRAGSLNLYNVDDLISNARAMSIQQLESLEAALKPHEVD